MDTRLNLGTTNNIMRNIKLKNMMHSYFEEAFLLRSPQPLNEAHSCIPEEVPVSVSVSTWKIVTSPNRLMKIFEFNNFDSSKAFLDELLDYQENLGHHAKLTVDARKIIIEVYTHDVDDVTELDTEYASTADAIYEDVRYFGTPNIEEDDFGF